MARPSLPLVRLDLIKPFADELSRRGINVDDVMARLGWSPDLLGESGFWVAAQAVYNFTEFAAQAADDRFLGARIGYATSIRNWPPFADALSQSRTYGECLFRVCGSVRPHSTSIIYKVSSDGELATFSSHRTFNPIDPPGQVDAFGAGHHLQIFRSALAGKVDFEAVTIRVCDPAVVPADIVEGARVKRTDKRGFSFTFPAAWLTRRTRRLAKPSIPAGSEKVAAQELPDLARITRDMLGARLSDSDFTIESAARFLGLSRRAYQLALRDLSTSYGAILNDVRKDTALRLLGTGTEPISVIAEKTGYRSVSNFSRAFRSWTGKTPKQFREVRRPD